MSGGKLAGYGGKFTYVSQFLDTVGNGTGTTNANVDGSSTAQLFKVSPPDSGKIVVTRLIATVRDAGAFSAEKYGALNELTNGVKIGLFNNTTGAVVQEFSSCTSNAGWGTLCYDVDLKEWGAGDKFIVARWTFSKSDVDIALPAGGNIAFGALMQDDLTGLVEHFFLVQGHRT